METRKALIVAHKPADRQSLRLLIHGLPDLDVVGECEGREHLLDDIHALDADVVVLDAAWLGTLLGTRQESDNRFSPANGADSVEGEPKRSRIAVKRSNGRVTLIAVEEIVWVEAARDYVRLHTAEGAHLVRQTMSRIETQLDSGSFVRIHRSTIARVESVREIKYDHEGRCLVLLSDGTERAASRAGRKRLQEALGFSI
jgi:DNA-binding LytR/AlgR family response regulator